MLERIIAVSPLQKQRGCIGSEYLVRLKGSVPVHDAATLADLLLAWLAAFLVQGVPHVCSVPRGWDKHFAFSLRATNMTMWMSPR